MNKALTIKDIAKHAGVSIASASIAFSNKKSNIRLSEKTRRRILAVAEKYNYSPNVTAKAFQAQKSFLLGFFFGSPNWYIQMGILQGIRSVCHKYDYDIIVYPAANTEEAKHNLQSARVRELDAILTISSAASANLNEYRKLAALGIPIVQLINRISDEFPLIGQDYYKIGYNAVEQLVKCGHRRIGHVCSSLYENKEGGQDSWLIANGCRDAAAEYGVELRLYPVTRKTYADDFREAETVINSILKSPQIPTALIMRSLRFMYAAYNIFIRQDIRIPEDISLLCCGNYTESFFPSDFDPACYEVPLFEIGMEAAKKCLDMPDAFPGKELLLYSPPTKGNTIRKIKS
ncbi:MAG: LacI family DNA-binding transcriptional regulator [Victivallales bacterium]|nr:LacI family DNA-binding transcriptional regulator [Victivallales bacterium]